MSAAPSSVLIKRRRGEEAPEALILEEARRKRVKSHVEYRLQSTSAPQHNQTGKVESTTRTLPGPSVSVSERPIKEPRQYQLARKRSAGQAGLVATFEERKALKASDDAILTDTPTRTEVGSETPTSFKRPGANARKGDWKADAIESGGQSGPGTPVRPSQVPPTALVNRLHQFALEEAAEEDAQEKPRVLVQPKRPVRRWKDRQPAAETPQHEPHQKNGGGINDVAMGDDEDYVFDVYVRCDRSTKMINPDTTDPTTRSVGYLIITEQDEELWETYLEDDEDDKDWDSEDEDENAENYYGADYPEDEVASDDEHNKGAYGYRHGGSDDEQWGSDAEAWSEDEDVMRNPWKQQPWMKAKKGLADLGMDEEDDDDDEDK